MRLPAVTPPASPPASQWQIWGSTLRWRTLPAGLVPVLVGSALAAARGSAFCSWQRAVLMLGCALLIQIGTNLYNDYADFQRGADTLQRLGPARASASGWLPAQQVRRAAYGSFALAALAGVFLVQVGGWPVLLMGLCSIAFGLAYTGGPYPLAYHALGELFVFLFFGLVAVCGAYYVHTLQRPPVYVWSIASSIGLLASAILVVNNLRDWQTDQRVHKYTLAVYLGPTRTRWLYAILLLAAYSALGASTALLPRPWGGLLPLCSAPYAAHLVWCLRRTQGAALNAMLARTAQLELLVGLLVSLGVLL